MNVCVCVCVIACLGDNDDLAGTITIFQLLQYLYDTYISRDSATPLNISWDIIKKLHQMFEIEGIAYTNHIENQTQYLKIFDSAAEQIYVLVRRDTYKRFTSSREYRAYTMQKNDTLKNVEITTVDRLMGFQSQ